MTATRWFPCAAVSVGCALVGMALASPRVEVAAELQRLMAQHGFEVRGIEQTATADAWVEGEELLPRLRMLLEDFDHVIIQTPQGGVERIIILGEKVAYVPPPMPVEGDGDGEPPESSAEGEIILPTQRRGSSHAVTLSLEGPNGQRVQQMLVVDTGADQVVLPASLLAPLGIATRDLRNQKVQTANGSVDARIGTLKGIWLGEQRIPGVEAAFIDDARLGGYSLLGMNVLGRFRMTIDDENNQLALTRK